MCTESKAAPRDAKSKASKHLPTAIDNFYAKLVPALEVSSDCTYKFRPNVGCMHLTTNWRFGFH